MLGKKKYLWKTVLDGLVSQNNDFKWTLNKWESVEGPIKCCRNGFHASENILDAINYVKPGLICKVEVKGKHDSEYDKSAWASMRIVKAYEWTKADSVALSIYAAEECIAIYEEQVPGDDRPRKAIEAAKEWLKNPTEANRSAESAAESAASAAESAAESAAWSALGKRL